MSPLDLVASIGTTSFTIVGSVLAVSLGLTGAIVALIKLPGDKSAASTLQAQGANAALVQTLEAVERERDYWRRRWEACHKEKSDLHAELLQFRHERRSTSTTDPPSERDTP